MTKFDDIFVPLAKNLINETFGFTATLRRETRTFVPATGKNTATSTDYSVKITPPSPFNRKKFPDAAFEDGDMMTMVAGDGLTIVPSPVSDFLVYAGTVWQVMMVLPIVSGEQTAAYRLQVRQ